MKKMDIEEVFKIMNIDSEEKRKKILYPLSDNEIYNTTYFYYCWSNKKLGDLNSKLESIK